MTKNLTLKLDEHLISKAKQKAIGEGTSLSQVVAEYLKKFCRQESDIEEARRNALKYMEKGFNLGSKPLSRQEIYESPRKNIH